MQENPVRNTGDHTAPLQSEREKGVLRELFIEKMKDIIKEEEKKDEPDTARITECRGYIAELEKIEPLYTDEELDTSCQALISEHDAHQTASKRIPHKTVRILIASVFLALCFAVCISAAAPKTFFETIWSKLRTMDVGASVSDGNTEYVYGGAASDYSSIEELVREKKLRLLFPAEFPVDMKVKTIRCSEENQGEIHCTFDEADFSISIKPDNGDSYGIRTYAEPFVLNDRTFYLFDNSAENEYYIYTVYENMFYSFKGSDYPVLLKIISSLDEADYE